ncbi:ABC transporter ATP-binding protein [Halobaculum sp. MBLA0143]|uniref:ABC transporter ATP-binding protein n=1 Tax=Halobaculum sp. MBLA0143 TaxID=3079933 RepID=UPI0035256CFF
MSGGGGPVVETEGLRKEYGETVAVASLDLSIPAGEVYGLLGPNGAGKTTTMRLLATLVAPTAGTAEVCGVPVTDRRAVTREVGFLPEEPPLFEELTGREQLEYAAGIRGLSVDAEAALSAAGLGDAVDRRIEAYSTGMAKRLGLLQATVHDPALLILDEPTSGLDPRAARRVRETIRTVAGRGTTVLLSTHVLPVAEAVSDRVGVFVDGRLRAEGPPTELRDRREDLEDAFMRLTDDHAGAGPAALSTND